MRIKNKMKMVLLTAVLGTCLMQMGGGQEAMAAAQNGKTAEARLTPGVKTEKLHLTQEWDKVFPKSDKVDHQKVTFHNRYGITLAADLYTPKGMKAGEKRAAIAVSGPFGAVKEQASGLYAQQLAERGYITLAFDPSFTGESGGNVRNVASPDINTEDFSAAIDFLAKQKDVDANRLGLLGICGFGGIAINDAAMDTRVKATVASTMYDMTRVLANGYFDKEDSPEQRHRKLESMNAQRTEDYKNDTFARAGGCLKPDELQPDTPEFVKQYTAYYETKRGFHPRSVNSTEGWNATSALSFINLPFLQRSNEIQSAVMVVAGEKAHSRYFSEDAFRKLQGSNKELVIVPGATHTDLYDQMDKIPFDKIDEFYQTYLK